MNNTTNRDIYSSSPTPTDRDLFSSSGVDVSSHSTRGSFDVTPPEPQPPKKAAKKKSPVKRAVIAVLLLLVFGVFGFAAWFAAPIISSLSEYEAVKLDTDDLGFEKSLGSGVTNIALFGCDTRSGTDIGGRSDSIMILSINTKTKKIHIFSVMRDTLVKIDGYGGQKINTAYRYGGGQLAVKTLNQSFGLDIEDYVSINFVGMAKVIDALGGIEATLSEAEVKDANKHMIDQAEAESKASGQAVEPDYIEKAGKQTLSGMQAVAFARIRDVKNSDGKRGDYGRTDRQRYVLGQLYEKLLQVGIGEYDDYIDLLLPYVESSLSTVDILRLGYCLAFMDLETVQLRAPQTDWVISSGYSVKGAGSTVYYDLEYAGEAMRAMIYDDLTYEEFKKANPVRKNEWYK